MNKVAKSAGPGRGLLRCWIRECADRDAAAARATEVESVLGALLREGKVTIEELARVDARATRALLRETLHRDLSFREHALRVRALGLPPFDRKPQPAGAASGSEP